MHIYMYLYHVEDRRDVALYIYTAVYYIYVYRTRTSGPDTWTFSWRW